MASEGQIQVAHIENADTASAAIGVAPPAQQRVYVLAVYYRNGSAGALTPKLVSNAKSMWAGTSQAAGVASFYNLSSGIGGIPVSDSTNAVTFLSTASATSDLTVWFYYGP